MPTITHKFVSVIPEGADSSKVRTSNWNDEHNFSGFTNLVSTDYKFTPQLPGGSLTAGITNTITLSPVPDGIYGTNQFHYLYISGGTGAPEAVLITGGTAISGTANGTISFVPANAHSGAWTISTATAGIQEAINAALGNNVRVQIPYGDHIIYATIRIYGNNVVIKGEGTQTTRIVYSGQNTTAHIFHMEANSLALIQFNTIADLGIQVIGTTMTGGYAIYTKNQAHLYLGRIFTGFTYHGIYLEGTIIAHLLELWVEYLGSPNGIGMFVKNGIDSVNDVMVDHFFTNGGSMSGTGILVESCGYMSIFRASCINCNYGILLAPPNGQYVASLDVISSYFDHCGAAGILLAPTGTGGIIRCTFSLCWCGTCTGQGLWISAPGTGEIDGIHFNECKFFDNGSHGVIITGTNTIKNFNLIDCTIAGNSKVGAGLNNGITILAPSKNMRITNNVSGAVDGFPDLQGWGLYMGTAQLAEQLTVQDNNFIGNTIGQSVSDHTGLIKSIKDNMGVTEVAISYTPSGALNLAGSMCERVAINGTGNITSITPGWKGRRIKLTFFDINPGTLGGSASIPCVYNPNSCETIELEFDGTYWL